MIILLNKDIIFEIIKYLDLKETIKFLSLNKYYDQLKQFLVIDKYVNIRKIKTKRIDALNKYCFRKIIIHKPYDIDDIKNYKHVKHIFYDLHITIGIKVEPKDLKLYMLPISVTHLKFGRMVTKLEKNIIPNTIQKLTFMNDIENMEPDIIPNSVEYLKMDTLKPSYINCIPKSVKKLKIIYVSQNRYESQNNIDFIMSSFESVKMSIQNYRISIPSCHLFEFD